MVVAEEEQEETRTYEVTFYVATRYINSEVKESFSLYDDYGYTDQEWDEMPERARDRLFDEWLNEWYVEQIEAWGDVS
jgi:hypothetical protein